MELSRDIFMDNHSIHAKQGHFGSSTQFLAAERRVVHRSWGARRRLWDLLPPKALPEQVSYLDIPEAVTTEKALWDYVCRHRPGWVHSRYGR